MGHLKAGVLSFVICVVSWGSQAQAIPILQLYVEGAVYDTTTETWSISPAQSSGGQPFRIWAIGNIDGPGGSRKTIKNVRLAAVYDKSVGDITITLTPALMGGTGSYLGFTDDSGLPSIPVPTFTSAAQIQATEGTVPILGSGKELPSHGEYGAGRIWQEFKLGDFLDSNAKDSIGDFIGGFPVPQVGDYAQISVYDVSVTGNFGLHPFTIHFDLYDTVYAGTHAKSKFAPFSHDGDADVRVVPEPSAAVLLLSALASLGAGCFVRRRTGVLSLC